MSGIVWTCGEMAFAQAPTQPRKSPTPTAAAASKSSVPATESKEITNSIGMKLKLIPAGEFLMGGGEKAEDLVKAFPQYGITVDFLADEFPQHRVRITRPFYFSKY